MQVCSNLSTNFTPDLIHRVVPGALRREASYALPRDAIRLFTNDERVFALADRLWERSDSAPLMLRRGQAPLELSIEVRQGAGSLPRSLREEWAVGTNEVGLSLSRALHARIEFVRGRLSGWVSAALLESDPSLVARLLLETSVAVLLARRSYGVVHAGAVAGRNGAVVIRGAAGAGKSTLVAAAHRAGLEILGDETVLVARDNPDDLLAAVRDVTLLPDAAELLRLQREVQRVEAGGEQKLRLDLFPSSSPARRKARRVATVVLGSRSGGPARLEPLNATTFLEEFGRGEIPQERWSGTPPTIASYWARRGAYRLSGTADLRGAIGLLSDLVDAQERPV